LPGNGPVVVVDWVVDWVVDDVVEEEEDGAYAMK
jgi:hypothetical protein